MQNRLSGNIENLYQKVAHILDQAKNIVYKIPALLDVVSSQRLVRQRKTQLKHLNTGYTDYIDR